MLRTVLALQSCLLIIGMNLQAQTATRFAAGGGPLNFAQSATAISQPMLGTVATEGSAPSSGMPYLFYPMAGIQGEDFGMANYVDLQAGPGVMDFNCGPFSYDGHDASDASIMGFDEQAIGVPIFAAADGLVIASHDGEFDMNTVWMGQPANFVVLDHGAGLETHYYHMKMGSVAVVPGQSVKAGKVLGLVGSSGNSSGPHLHFATFLNGQIVEPFSGPCNPGPSGWVNQPPLPNQAKMFDFAFTTTNLNGVGPPGSLPRSGSKTLATTNFYFWYALEALPANSTIQVEFFRPNGSLSYSSPVYNFGNTEAYSWSWWWQGWVINEMQTISGDWTVSLLINGQALVNAAFTVQAAAVPNRPPLPLTLAMEPAAPTDLQPIRCRVTSNHLLNDPDYDIVRVRWHWLVNGMTVRDVTTAARSDMLDSGKFSLGDTVTCEATPMDGLTQAALTSVSTSVGSGFNYEGSFEDFDLATGINIAPTLFPDIKLATGGDLLWTRMYSDLGSYDLVPPVLYAQQFPTGTPPFAPPGYPEVHLDFAPFVVYPIIPLFTGLGNPLLPGLLPPGGLTLLFSVPTGLSGFSAMLQSYCLVPSPNRGNPYFTASHAQEIRFQ